MLKNEGGLTDNPNDPGQITNMGISLRFLKALQDPRKYGIKDNPVTAETISGLTGVQVREIYFREFWQGFAFEKINSQDVANYVFDCAVNAGMAQAVKLLQRAIWAVWHNMSIVVDDGILGPKTLTWVERCPPEYLLPALRSERAGFFRLTAKANPDAGKEFLDGWLARAYAK